MVSVGKQDVVAIWSKGDYAIIVGFPAYEFVFGSISLFYDLITALAATCVVLVLLNVFYRLCREFFGGFY